MNTQFESLPNMSSVDFGNMGRYFLVSYLIARNAIVSLPLTENAPYDLLVDFNQRIYRVQVKTTRSDGNIVEVKTRTIARVNGKYISKPYDRTMIDWLIILDLTTTKHYLLDYTTGEFDNKKLIYLRIAAAKNKRANIRWANDYELATTLLSVKG